MLNGTTSLNDRSVIGLIMSQLVTLPAEIGAGLI